MTLIVSRPNTLDVTRTNPRDVLYISGDANTDGSFRITLNAAGETIRLEERVSGIWVLAPLDHHQQALIVLMVQQLHSLIIDQCANRKQLELLNARFEETFETDIGAEDL